MPENRSNNYFRISCFISFLILTAIVFILPDGFNEYGRSDMLAPFWYWVTISGGVFGIGLMIIYFTVYLLINYRNKTSVKKNIFIFIFSVIIIQIVISTLTLYYLKDVFKDPRPSQLYFVEKGFIENSGKEFFSMPSEEKSKYLRKTVDSNKNSFEDVYPPILESWIFESGYSFPSGHAQSAFFMGTILAFVFYKTNPKKYYYIVPLIWAVLVALSRVLIGVHYPQDVVIGALMSMVIALIIVSLKKINIIFD